jgi:hypothetical protein
LGHLSQTDILCQSTTQPHGFKASPKSTIVRLSHLDNNQLCCHPTLDSSVIAALARINRENELAFIFRPLPIISPAGNLIAIAGNMNDKRSELAFIKINEDCIGSFLAIQNHREIPLEICSEIPLLADLLSSEVEPCPLLPFLC